MHFRSVHFIGIGGSGMSGIARFLLERGVRVSGSDLSESERTRSLIEKGARVYYGHSPDHVGDPDCVVVSSAIPADNPELLAARRRGLPVISRGEMLARLSREAREVIAVAGTHGKTTTTAMIGWALERSGLDPSVIVGAEFSGFGSNARSGRGPHMVVETDESDRSFLLILPHVAVVTNIEEDHLENYAGIEDIQGAFARFIGQMVPAGLAVLCGDDPRARLLAPLAPGRVLCYGLRGDCAYRASDVKLGPLSSEFALWRWGRPMGRVKLGVPGLHNVRNALAAIAVCCELGTPLEPVREALAQFRGASRRFEVIGEAAGVLIVDDYAHHPTEVRATLSAARPLNRRTVVIFQPHRYTRTQKLGPAFAGCFGDADVLVLTDIYAASEPPIPGVSVERLAREIEKREGRPVQVIRPREAIASALLPQLRPGDLVITLGAGDIRATAFELYRLLAGTAETSGMPGEGNSLVATEALQPTSPSMK